MSDNTLYKYETDDNRFFKDVPFFKMPLNKITEEAICKFIHDTVIWLELPKTSCKRLVEYIKSTITYARRNGYIDARPEEFIKASDFYKFCKPVPEKTTISDDDLQKILTLLKYDHVKQPEYIPVYAVELASYTYFRVSELSALKWNNVDLENRIVYVCESEKRNRRTGECWIGDTKNGKHRMIPLDPAAEELLRQLQIVQEKMGVQSEFVFADRNGRIHSSVISSCIKNKCRQLGIKEIGIHGLRRKGNSVLRSNGLSNVAAASLLGNSKEVNDQYYTFDEVDFESKRAVVEEANRRLHRKNDPGIIDPDTSNTPGSPREPKKVISMFEFKKRRNAYE